MTEKNSKDEIDVLSLFSLIGKKTNSLLVLIINFFISFLNLIVSLLYLVKRNYLILLISLLIGSLIGYFYEKNLYVPKYQTTLTLSPNFGSTYHLYENIKFYQSLIRQEDFEKLSDILKIDSTEAKSLLSISIEPYKNEELNLKGFEQLLNMADSNTGLTLTYSEYADKIPFESYISHVIKLNLSNNKIPPQLEHSIITALEKNKYYRDKKNTYLKNLKIKREYVEASIQKIDTLLFAKKGTDNDAFNRKNLGTTILLDKSQNTNLKLKLFDNYSTLNNELIYINNELNKKANIINIISSFPMIAEISNENKSPNIVIGLFLFLFTLIIILFKRINALLGQDPNFKIKLVNYKK
ncbi:MAG: hypothetical protein ISQ95_03040 [Flavobacteriales bacterium]|nr:hypothetical protein [Flavobacteriales bacterium]